MKISVYLMLLVTTCVVMGNEQDKLSEVSYDIPLGSGDAVLEEPEIPVRVNKSMATNITTENSTAKNESMTENVTAQNQTAVNLTSIVKPLTENITAGNLTATFGNMTMLGNSSALNTRLQNTTMANNSSVVTDISSLKNSSTTESPEPETLSKMDATLPLQQTLDDLLARVTKLEADNGALKAETEAIKAENSALRADNAMLWGNNSALWAESSALHDNNALLWGNNSALWADNSYLQKAAITLEAKSNLLLNESDNLRAKTKHQQNKIDAQEKAMAEIGRNKAQIQSVSNLLKTTKERLEQERCEIGEVTTYSDNNYKGRNGNRGFPVTFKTPFPGTPVVMLAHATMDVSNDENLRMMLKAHDVSPSGFRLVANSWWNTHVHSWSVSYMACYL